MWFRRRENSIEELEKKVNSLTKLLEEQRVKIQDLEEREKKLEQMLAEERSKLEKSQQLFHKVLLENPQIRRLILYTLNQLDKERKSYFESIPGSRADVIVFHHNDLDGILSGALIQRKLEEDGKDFKIFHIPQYRRDLIPKAKPINTLICSDLALNQELATYLLQLEEAGLEVKFFDHHPSMLDPSILSPLEERGILVWDVNAPSTTTLVFEHFGFRDEKARKLKEIAEVCDTARAKRYPSLLEREVRSIEYLLTLGEDEISQAREELAKHGEIMSKELLEKAEMAQLLAAFTMRELENMRFYDSKYFQVYCVDRDTLPLRAIKRAASQLHQKVQKDVYVNVRKGGIFRFSGKSKLLSVPEVLCKVAPMVNAIEIYGRRNIGGIIFEASEEKLRKIIEWLEQAYQAAQIQREANRVIRIADRIGFI
ncbi:MAG: DHH family phosphoesterase [Candidatus Nanoarchaeia archaeon]|nr:DHH family phosphoesterase [Candidatus Haiyanarchaeum thermophilum]MCW1302878.1 DHH family phosphoesterase [Candidatus Haiyanarchaeum thermophilum]MCW1303557.1 DHH family phosphoesterase [Candidatus Haiyanarchaeum thermophilum]MCW1306239.1 DHH family phosphoesterase [Candidatus Haiyanarchaeum thermophilum]MCW1307525.1 DHH family phosphoesterase [Candidatus Haiyanarchaeum thermophilum]